MRVEDVIAEALTGLHEQHSLDLYADLGYVTNYLLSALADAGYVVLDLPERARLSAYGPEYDPDPDHCGECAVFAKIRGDR